MNVVRDMCAWLAIAVAVHALDEEPGLTALHQVDNPGRVRLFDLLARPGFGLADRVPG